MALNKHQHIVPQQMIKRFAGTDDKLVELYKPKLTIGTRRRSPRGILFKDDFYRDRFSDFDEELLQKVEQKFAKFYPAIADQEKPKGLPEDGGAALIDWIAAMLCRTRILVCLSQVVAGTKNSGFANIWKLNPATMNNIVRSLWFKECQDLLSRPDFRWKMRIFPKDHHIVLTDHPVCQTNGLSLGGQITIVPLTRNRVLFGGFREAVEKCGTITSVQLNAFLAAYAAQSIFAADIGTLENVKENLEGKGFIGTEEWCMEARKPFFGLRERIQAKIPSSNINTSQWWENFKDSYGQSILPDAQDAARIFADVSIDGSILKSNNFPWEIRKSNDQDGNILYTIVVFLSISKPF